MSDLALAHRIGRNEMVCVSELSSETLAEHGLKGATARAGLYLFVIDNRPRVGGINVLARVTSTDAAFEILELFKKLAPEKKRAGRSDNKKPRPKSKRKPKTKTKTKLAR